MHLKSESITLLFINLTLVLSKTKESHVNFFVKVVLNIKLQRLNRFFRSESSRRTDYVSQYKEKVKDEKLFLLLLLYLYGEAGTFNRERLCVKQLIHEQKHYIIWDNYNYVMLTMLFNLREAVNIIIIA